MPANTERTTTPSHPNEASANALAREKEAAKTEIPVKQHNPDDKGINPEQKGPAQPADNSP